MNSVYFFELGYPGPPALQCWSSWFSGLRTQTELFHVVLIFQLAVSRQWSFLKPLCSCESISTVNLLLYRSTCFPGSASVKEPTCQWRSFSGQEPRPETGCWRKKKPSHARNWVQQLGCRADGAEGGRGAARGGGQGRRADAPVSRRAELWNG